MVKINIQGHARKTRISQQKKLNRMIVAVIVAFLLSWSPYCLVRLISNFTGRHVTTPVFSLVPELMAKMSVFYNPLIVTYFNRPFRTTLLRLIRPFVKRIWFSQAFNFSKLTLFQETNHKKSFYLKHINSIDLIPWPQFFTNSVLLGNKMLCFRCGN